MATVVVCLTSSSVHAALIITEVASTSGAPAGPLESLDWWELTNTGPLSVLLDGYSWEDNPVSNDRAIFPNGISVAAGESIVIHQGTGVVAPFRTTWGLSPTVQVLSQDQFGGTNLFSGLGSGGDAVNLFDASNVLAANVSFGPSTSGRTFEWDTNGGGLGLSVNGEKGAHLSSYGGVGSPGIAVPEPAAAALLVGTMFASVGCGLRRRK
jgi:hypothetical protein